MRPGSISLFISSTGIDGRGEPLARPYIKVAPL